MADAKPLKKSGQPQAGDREWYLLLFELIKFFYDIHINPRLASCFAKRQATQIL
jgi:hypothetical protein